MTRAILLGAFFVAFSVSCTAREPDQDLTAQQVAQARANWIVSRPRPYYWHAPFSVSNVWRVARFEGCGFGRPGQHVTWSCRPRRRMKLVADAYATGKHMSVRVRLWR